MSNLYERLSAMYHTPYYEVRGPAPGLRHNADTIFVPHRFPVKDGISWRDVMKHGNRNKLLDYVVVRDEQ